MRYPMDTCHPERTATRPGVAPVTADPAARPLGALTTHRALLDQLLDSWSVAVLELLCEHPARFNELRRGIPPITQKSLAATLRRLERNGIVQRTVLSTRPVAVQYRITPLGKTLRAPVDALLGWVDAHAAEVAHARAAFDDDEPSTAAAPPGTPAR